MPRTIAQGEALEQMGVEIDKVLNLTVEDSIIMERMSGRRVCAKCGASYHVKNKPSAKPGVCDRCGGELVTRKGRRTRHRAGPSQSVSRSRPSRWWLSTVNAASSWRSPIRAPSRPPTL